MNSFFIQHSSKKTASLSFRMSGKKGLLNDYVSIAQKVNGQ
ncbi:MAG: hypothetical protein ACLTO1_18340 [Dysgonomonas mossii]